MYIIYMSLTSDKKNTIHLNIVCSSDTCCNAVQVNYIVNRTHACTHYTFYLMTIYYSHLLKYN